MAKGFLGQFKGVDAFGKVRKSHLSCYIQPDMEMLSEPTRLSYIVDNGRCQSEDENWWSPYVLSPVSFNLLAWRAGTPATTSKTDDFMITL